MDNKYLQVEISPLASYAGEGLDKYKGTTLTAPCSINKVVSLVILAFEGEVLYNSINDGHIFRLMKIIFTGGYAEWDQLKDSIFFWSLQMAIALLFLSSKAGTICLL